MFAQVFPNNKKVELVNDFQALVNTEDGTTTIVFDYKPDGWCLEPEQDAVLAYAAEYIREVRLTRLIQARKELLEGQAELVKLRDEHGYLSNRGVETLEKLPAGLEAINQQIHLVSDVYTHEVLLTLGTGDPSKLDNTPFPGQD